MEVILDDLASKSRVLYEEGKFKEVEEMFNTFIKESGQFKASDIRWNCDGPGCANSPDRFLSRHISCSEHLQVSAK